MRITRVISISTPRVLGRIGIVLLLVLALASTAEAFSLGKVFNHVVNEVEHAATNVAQAVQVAVKVPERVIAGTVSEVTKAAGEIGKGQVLKGLGDLALTNLKVQENVAFQSVQQSSLIRMVAQVGASAYGGAAGSAAFAAWYTYRSTGNLQDAVRAAAESAVVKEAGAGIQALPLHNFLDVARNAALNCGIVGGAATVSGGGGALGEGCRQGALSSAANDSYRLYTGQAPDGRAPDKPSIPKSLTPNGCDGLPMGSGCIVYTPENMKNIDPRIDNVGIATLTPGASGWMDEGSDAMELAGLVPGVNAMAYLHDPLSITLPSFLTQLTIPPALGFTWAALGANTDQLLLKLNTPALEDPALRETILQQLVGGDVRIGMVATGGTTGRLTIVGTDVPGTIVPGAGAPEEITPVPEGSSLVLLGFGLSALAWRRWSRS
jgi:hypothetical protein